MTEFKNIPIEIVKEIATLAFHSKDWVTSEMEVKYQPYIPEWYEDAEEYFEATFTGYFAGNSTAEYRVKLYPNWNVYLWYTYNKTDEKNIVHYVSNQSKIQELLNHYKK
jgi:hypothetical protein